MTRNANPFVGPVLFLSPSSVERWQRCRRQYRNRDLLHLPRVHDISSPNVGVLTHRVLQELHARGVCRDPARRAQLIGELAGSHEALVGSFVERHAVKCPQDVDPGRHEVELARPALRPPPRFVVTGKIDAIWIHDGLLDACDYKTGGCNLSSVTEDLAARVQAFLLAPHARKRSLRLRIRYEYLAPEIEEDPEPFYPDDDDLESIRHELTLIAHEILDESVFAGCGETAVCQYCDFQPICPDVAAQVGAPVAHQD